MIAAIVGKSGSGKDRTADLVVRRLKECSVEAHKIVMDTTRPARDGEVDRVDYRFLSGPNFIGNAANGKYAEYQTFRGWMYGTPYMELTKGDVAVGAFSPQSVVDLTKTVTDPIVVLTLDSDGWLERLRRSIKREGRRYPSWEMLRRLWADHKDFKSVGYWRSSLADFVPGFHLYTESTLKVFYGQDVSAGFANVIQRLLERA